MTRDEEREAGERVARVLLRMIFFSAATGCTLMFVTVVFAFGGSTMAVWTFFLSCGCAWMCATCERWHVRMVPKDIET